MVLPVIVGKYNTLWKAEETRDTPDKTKSRSISHKGSRLGPVCSIPTPWNMEGQFFFTPHSSTVEHSGRHQRRAGF
jgi:hypothetical protein